MCHSATGLVDITSFTRMCVCDKEKLCFHSKHVLVSQLVDTEGLWWTHKMGVKGSCGTFQLLRAFQTGCCAHTAELWNGLLMACATQQCKSAAPSKAHVVVKVQICRAQSQSQPIPYFIPWLFPFFFYFDWKRFCLYCTHCSLLLTTFPGSLMQCKWTKKFWFLILG